MITSDASVKLDFVSSDDKFLADGDQWRSLHQMVEGANL